VVAAEEEVPETPEAQEVRAATAMTPYSMASMLLVGKERLQTALAVLGERMGPELHHSGCPDNQGREGSLRSGHPPTLSVPAAMAVALAEVSLRNQRQLLLGSPVQLIVAPGVVAAAYRHQRKQPMLFSIPEEAEGRASLWSLRFSHLLPLIP